jgi:guanylate kinase
VTSPESLTDMLSHGSQPTGRPFRRGNIFIVSAPSGAGKTTLCKALRAHFPDLAYSISYTTRSPRPGEKHGVDYYFITREEFVRRINENQWAEWARVYDHYYGTSAEHIRSWLDQGKDVLLDIDIQGTLQMLERFPEIVTIFIMPPSVDALRERIMSRGTDPEEVVEMRLDSAKDEMAQKDLYRYIIVNDVLERAARELIELIAAYRNRDLPG